MVCTAAALRTACAKWGTRFTDSRLWCDGNHVRGGPTGVHWFLGQPPAPEHAERIMVLIANEEDIVLPQWVRLLVWFSKL